MVWALAAILILGAGLPIAAWQFSRRLQAGRPPQSAGGFGPPADAVDKWLIDRYQLPALKRWEVRRAVTFGRELRDPAPRSGARDLAARVLHGELRTGRSVRLLAWIMLAEGCLFLAAGILAWISLNAIAGIFAILWAVWFLGVASMAIRAARRGPERAYRVNT
jgi:hypothetical protein